MFWFVQYNCVNTESEVVMSVTDNKQPSNDERLKNPAATPSGQVTGVNGVNSQDISRDIWGILPLSDLYSIVLEIYRKGRDLLL